MKGIIALVFGIIAFITGTLGLILPAAGIVTITTIVFGIIGMTVGNRAWRNDRQVVGLIGFILAMIGWVEMLIVVFLVYIL